MKKAPQNQMSGKQGNQMSSNKNKSYVAAKVDFDGPLT